jgi:hypothetical protein
MPLACPFRVARSTREAAAKKGAYTCFPARTSAAATADSARAPICDGVIFTAKVYGEGVTVNW